MTPLNLLIGLKKMLESELSNFELKSEREQKKIGVYLHLANENFTREDLYPLILISLVQVDDLDVSATRAAQSLATVELTVGIFGEDREAFFDLLNVLEYLRQLFIKQQTIDARHRLTLPMKTEILENQPYPFQFGYMRLQYTIGRKFD